MQIERHLLCMIKAHVQTKNMIGIMITHDKRLFEYADRVIEIQDGKSSYK